MRDINTIVLTDSDIYFIPAASTGSVVSFSYDEMGRIEAFLSELETVYARQEFNILCYSKSDELILSDAPALKPWEVASFIATHREERYGSQERVFVHTDYTRCNGNPILRDWVLPLNDQSYSVYESLLAKDILILAVYSFPSSLSYALSHAGQDLKSTLKNVVRLGRSHQTKNLIVVYDCKFIYFFIIDRCGTLFFRHTPIEDNEKGNVGLLIIREVDLTLRFVLAKGVISDSDKISFNLIVPDELLHDARLCNQKSFVGLSLLSNLSVFNCNSFKFLLKEDIVDGCNGLSIPLLKAIVTRYPGFPFLKTQTGKVKRALLQLSAIMWISLFVVGVYLSYYVGDSISRLISLQEGVSTLHAQKSKLEHLRHIIQSKLNLLHDPSDMYQLVLFNDVFTKVHPNNLWTIVYLPLQAAVEPFSQEVKIREFTFEDHQANLLEQPEYQVRALLSLPVDGYSLSYVDSLMETIVNRLMQLKGIKGVNKLKQPFDDDVKKLLKINLENYSKDYYFYIISYTFTPPKK